MQKDRFVQVVRHVRPYTFNNEYKYVRDNLGGATVVFDMDYEAGVVKARWSACSPDINFDKKEGKRRALQRDTMITFSLDEVKTFGGLVNALIWNIFIITGEAVTFADHGEFVSWIEKYALPVELYEILRESLREAEARK